ncbi:CzcABC family efflux RND transporter, membrane fusion protein [Olavius algarvensis associated proteobacterium Delta 3]|nr:CzcABC family efflux RND transporter, membrane fusion protein [Olavius algarvensis associated proteobacterium Delta 3]
MKINLFFRIQLGLLIVVIGSMLFVIPAASQQLVPVIVKEVTMDRFIDRVEALGTLRANESVELTASVSETVTAIHFEDGQRVEAGDILIEMTNEEEHALIAEEISTVAEAKKQYERMKSLVKRGSASKSLLDQRRREYETARARLLATESRLKDRLIVAPFSGLVGLRNISVGALIEPGDVITTLDDDSVMKLDFTIPAIHLSTLRIGLPIEARSPAFDGRKFNGTVSGINSRIDPTTRSIIARALLPNPERLLKPGMLMHVDLMKNPRDVLVIPEEALIPSGRENFVLIVDRTEGPTVAQRRKVTAGGRRPGDVEILDGLEAGEYVVIHGTLNTRPGQQVTVIAEDTGDEPLVNLLSKGQRGAGK